MFSLMQVSKYLNNPVLTHWNTVNCVLGHIRGTLNYGSAVKRKPDALQLKAFVDFDCANDVDTRSVMQLGDCAVTYSSKGQRTVSLSFTEAEYTALAHGTKEVIFLRELQAS
ncbi:LOW QUALITY PROTEIN: Retrovirus-related pol Polyprotein [Phytophthora megakarya]|uniref:Retrovirus-related pol Polyprotein n=1 Tax=Phytophthora megakarya TaxID=4795 RepID=A0A225UV39_9STRA|nr:LOW QUALITY PROTEIN: Retrovirus-related pol Polyprotein [Phytophthora megakarya]